MSFWSLVRRNLRHYWRTQLGVLLGVAIATAVLVGALVVGDSVRSTLADAARKRIGRIDAGLLAGERFFDASLQERLGDLGAGVATATVLQLQGLVKRTTGEAKAGIVDIYGVEQSFFALSPGGEARAAPKPGKAFLNARLAAQLGVAVGETVLARVEKPSAMPRDMILSTIDDISLALRVEVEAILGDADFGRFSLRSEQVTPFACFVSLPWLQKEVELGSKANALFVGASPDAAATTARAAEALSSAWSLGDAELYFRPVQDGVTELTSSRIFLDVPVVRAAREIDAGLVGLLTYFVNGIRRGDKATPYSMVSAVGTLGEAAAAPEVGALAELLALVDGLGASEAAANAWLREDLALSANSELELAYFVMGPNLALQDAKSSVTVRKFVPLAGAAADRGLMPEFPGISDSEHCRDWEPGIPVDLDRIRDKDEEYWDAHKGTPKLFVRLEDGRAMWRNRFGELTSIRGSTQSMERLRTGLRSKLSPGDFGYFFRDLRTTALATGTSATDFGGLFLGLSFFLIFSAILLAVMLFVFGVQQRAREVGTLLSIGYEEKTVRRVLTSEAFLVALFGAALGVVLALLYTRLVLWGLATVWKDAVRGTVFALHVQSTTVAGGAIASVFGALLAMRFALRKAFQQPAARLLKGDFAAPRANADGRRSKRSMLVAIVLALLALGLCVAALGAGSAAGQSGAFFGVGFLLLVAGIFGVRSNLLSVDARQAEDSLSFEGLAVRNIGRRTGRSLATIALLASGTFLVVSVQANRLRAPEDTSVRASGTGGFAFLGRSTIPVARDLTSVEGRESFGLDAGSQAAAALEGSAIVPLRVRAGDDASCLNLSAPRSPQLFGVRADELAKREAFVFAASVEAAGDDSPWTLLDQDFGPDVVPAIGDAASVTWTLKKSLGDDIEYRDESGRVFRVRIVATLQGSILQGSLVISDAAFRARFPSASGFQAFLIDTPREKSEAVASTLTDALEDVGLELVPTGERLEELNAVQNTYLLIFQLLGALGLLLGSVGLGMVVLRNVLERRRELALLGALGFDGAAIRALLFREHRGLVLIGVLLGALAAFIALAPSMTDLAILPVVGIVALVTLSGFAWVWLATWASTRGPLLQALRED